MIPKPRMNTDEYGWEKAWTRMDANYANYANLRELRMLLPASRELAKFASIRVSGFGRVIRVHPGSSVVKNPSE